MTEEGVRQREIMLAASKVGARLFRNNNAQGWVGDATVFKAPRRLLVGPGDVLVRRARVLHAGLIPGSCDLIGWTPLEIRAEHVGSTMAIFAGIEAKTPRGRMQDNQITFIRVVVEAGGVCGVATTDDEALALLATAGK